MVADKMVWTKWYSDKMSLAKMVWTQWYGQNGKDKMVASFGIVYNYSEISTYLVTRNHKQCQAHTTWKGINVEAGLMKKSYCQWERDWQID